MQARLARRQLGTGCGCTFVDTGIGGSSSGQGRFRSGGRAAAEDAHASASTAAMQAPALVIQVRCTHVKPPARQADAVYAVGARRGIWIFRVVVYGAAAAFIAVHFWPHGSSAARVPETLKGRTSQGRAITL